MFHIGIANPLQDLPAHHARNTGKFTHDLQQSCFHDFVRVDDGVLLLRHHPTESLELIPWNIQFPETIENNILTRMLDNLERLREPEAVVLSVALLLWSVSVNFHSLGFVSANTKDVGVYQMGVQFHYGKSLSPPFDFLEARKSLKSCSSTTGVYTTFIESQ